MTRYRIAAALMIAHGALLELGGALALVPLAIFGADAFAPGDYVTFIVPYLQDNIVLMLGMGVIFGTVRIIGAVGVLRNRMWGLALAVINCVVTMALMTFMLPAGIVDGLLACTALVLMLTRFFGTRPIVG